MIKEPGSINGGMFKRGRENAPTSPIITIKAASAGGYHIVGIDIDGTLWSWGDNGYGQLGDGTTISRNTPVKIQIPK